LRDNSEAGDGEDDGDEARHHPGGGRKGVSSGLSTVVRHGPALPQGSSAANPKSRKNKSEWWKDLGGSSKGSLRL